MGTLLTRAREHYSRKEYAPARSICDEILNRKPTHRVALYLSALCAVHGDHYDEAVTSLSKLVTHYPDHVNGLLLLSKVHLRLGDHRQSVLYARKVLDLDVTDDRVLALLADLFGKSEDHYSAKAAYERAIQLNPRNAAHWCNHASILRIEGRIEEAVKALERCIDLDAAYCKAHWMLSSLKRQTKSDNHIRRLRQVGVSRNVNKKGKMLINFALSKEYEDTGEYGKSFDCLLQACRLKRESIRYDVERDTLPFRQLENLFDSEYVDRMAGSGYTNCAPIFIVGLPRTGSTLIEQILGANGKLLAAGELPFFGNEVARMFHDHTGHTVDFSGVEAKDVDYRELGRRYVEKSMAFIQSARHKAAFDSSDTFIDKMPRNFLYVGFILLALPSAKVIVTQRNAMDTCLSNLKQLYNDPFYQFSYRLDEMGAYLIAWHRLMQHWLRLFGTRILTVEYEEFVDRPDVNAERIFEYCGVPWDRKYLDYAAQERLVATASATQVREAISKDSVNRWKHYEQSLQPLLSQLRHAGLVPQGEGHSVKANRP
ncbi:MAG: sulfotransferase [Woeseia sp.]